jgi:tripartite-type tricarboxylate transporter receptor subunit TctC
MKFPRRRFLHVAAGAAVLPAASRIAMAQVYPARQIRLIIGYPPGGGVDIVSRIAGHWLQERLGQPVIIESKPGAATNIAAQAVINSAPDGYTVLFLSATNMVNATFFKSLPFDILRDIAPVAGLNRFPMVLLANPKVPAATVAQLIALAKDNPGRISMASFGTGTSSHLAGELFMAMAGVNFVHVPYRGEAPALTDLIAGQVQVMFDVLTASRPHIVSGDLRALAVLGQTRYDGLPDLPTVSDTVPGYEASTWGGLGVPKGTASSIIETLNRAVNAGLADSGLTKRFAEVSATPMPFTPAEFGAFMRAEEAKWGKIVKSAGAKAD